MTTLDLGSEALPAVEELVSADEDEAKLFERLGARLIINKSNPKETATFTLSSEPEYETLGLRNDLIKFGQQYFQRVNQQCFNLVCGDDEVQSAERQKVVEAFAFGKPEVAAAIAALLVSQLAIAPAISAIVAALTIKLFFDPAHEAMCDVWKGRLPT